MHGPAAGAGDGGGWAGEETYRLCLLVLANKFLVLVSLGMRRDKFRILSKNIGYLLEHCSEHLFSF